ncbi:MAG: hypothetical protein IJU29_07605 [Oscillospiraceae bacterium]|nr:hypothetical protein [Oscillospiraceae bacterium]
MADTRRGLPDYDLDAILQEFGGDSPAPARKAPEESLADRSKRLVMKTMDDAFNTEGYDLLGGIIDETAARQEAERAAQPVQAAQPAAPEPSGHPVQLPPLPNPGVRPEREDGAFVSQPSSVSAQAEDGEGVGPEMATAAREPLPDLVTEKDIEAEAEAAPDTLEAERRQTAAKKKERFLSPLVGLMAMLAVKREKSSRAAAQPVRPVPEEEPRKDADLKTSLRLYSGQLRNLLLRARIATVLTAVMLYVTWGWTSFLPLTGALKSNFRAISMLLLVFQCVVMLAGLDIFTGGLLSFSKRRLGAETLVSVSCVLSVLDTLILVLADRSEFGLPLCAVSALSMTAALWGGYFACKNGRTGLRVLSSEQNSQIITAESGLVSDDTAILKTKRSPTGFLSRYEQTDVGEYVFNVAAPFLIVAAAVLGILAVLGSKRYFAVFHAISILSAAGTGAAAFICFTVPFAIAARRLSGSGAAVAGWAGLRELGRSSSLVIRDADLFPRGTVEVDRIRILESVDAEKVISYTGSVVAASGNALAGAFAELLRRNNCAMRRVDAFAPRDGGGMTAVIAGESIYIGSSGFMHLVGIRLPQAFNVPNAIFTAISGRLVGIFEVRYQPVSSVQEALYCLLQSPLRPIYAIRDFNITPVMVQTGFRLPNNDLRFPSYSERYRVSAAQPGKDSRVSAVVVRDGLGPLVDVAELSRRTYLATRISAAIALAGSVLGVVLCFILCWLGSFDSASAGNLLLFELLWCAVDLIFPFLLER